MVGTSRFKSNCPDKALKQINIEDTSFNEFYWFIGQHNTLIGCWKDNALVLVCSTVHTVGKSIERWRKNHVQPGLIKNI